MGTAFSPPGTAIQPLRIRVLLSLVVTTFVLYPMAEASAQSSPALLPAIEQEIVQLVRRAEPSIVSVIAQRRVIAPVDGRLITAWDRDVGSGVVISPTGHILTTESVVSGASTLSIQFADGRQWPAMLIGTDPLSSIAVLRVDSITTIPAELGDSDSIRVGSWAIMVGNSFGLPSSPSFGLVCGVRAEDGLLQMSAMISPGSTGGAVFSTDARVIGLIAGRLTGPPVSAANLFHGWSQVGGPRGVEWPASGAVMAIPINRVKAVARQLIEFGEVRRGWLGVDIRGIAGQNGGVPIERVYEGSPAEKAGLRPGDILIAVNGLSTTNLIALADRVANFPVGMEVELRYIRDHHVETARVRLGRRPAQLDRRPSDEYAVTTRPEQAPSDLELAVTAKSLNQWLLELEAEIQRLKTLEGELRNEQIRRVKAQPRR